MAEFIKPLKCKLESKIFESLKPVIKDLEKDGQKGCEIKFSDIDFKIVEEVIKMLRYEKIDVYDKSYFKENVDESTLILILDETNPCNECDDEQKSECLKWYPCPSYERWEKLDVVNRYLKEGMKTIKVSLKDNNIYVENIN